MSFVRSLHGFKSFTHLTRYRSREIVINKNENEIQKIYNIFKA
jgi:hypothetical protein